MAFVVLVICFIFNLLGRGIGDAYVTFLLPIETQFGWSRSEISSVYSIYMLANGFSAPLIGIMFDRLGPRVVCALGFTSLGLGYLVAGNLTHLWQFHLCVGVAGGIGVTSLGMVPSQSLISRWFPTNTSTAIGIAYAGFGAGTLVMVPFAQYLNDTVGWRNAYHVLGGMMLLLLPLAMLLPWRVIRAGHADYAHSLGAKPLSKNIFAPLRLAIRSPGFWALAQAFFFTSLVIYTVMVQTIAFLVESGFSAFEAASAFGVAGMLSVLGVGSSGKLADKFGHRLIVTVTFTCTFLGLANLLAMAFYPSVWFLFGFVAFFGIAQGARGPIISGLCSKLFPGPGLATIYGALYAFMSIGAASGALLSGWLHDQTAGYETSIIVSMASVTLAVSPFWVSRALRKFG
jgi:MFS family permease